MSKFYFTLALMFIAVAGWGIGSKLDSESFAMTVGICFGVMAGIPGALLLLESQRHGRHRSDYERPPRVQVEQPKPTPPPPQIVHNHVHYHAAQRNQQAEDEALHQPPGPAAEIPEPRRFRVVGGGM